MPQVVFPKLISLVIPGMIEPWLKSAAQASPMAAAPSGPPPSSRPRRGLHEWLLTNADQVTPEQARINHRLEGITPDSFAPARPRFCTIRDLNAPVGFANVWHAMKEDGTTTAFDGAYSDATEGCLIIFVNLMDRKEVESLMLCIREYSEHSDMFIIVTHSASVSSGESQHEDEIQLMISLIDSGVDDIIFGEPSGHKLACAVRARLNFHSGFSRGWSSACYKAQLLEHIHCIVWDYLRVRMDTHIPELDQKIAAGEPETIDNFKFGKTLGQGAFGKVVELGSCLDENENTGQVIKCISKLARNTVGGLKDLKNQIVAMETFSNEAGKHPNITQLLGVYHSKSHVFLRMESGGPEDLGHRLLSRDSKSGPPRLLDAHKSKNIVVQCTAALAHLHGEHQIAHRDVKPDNIILLEDNDNVICRLTDFGLAKIVTGNAMSRSMAGTLPYMSPEMVLENKSNVFSSDIWSLGVVFLDVLCFARFIERHVFRKQPQVKDRDSTSKKQHLMNAVFERCQFIEQLLQAHLRPELQELHTSSVVMLEGVLNVSPAKRWTFKDLLRCIGPEDAPPQ